jgi:6-pyruvoyltetrahydropterin/6-carboxytetrahydropterin synthase
VFGKCNNPFGHGHNYSLEVTVAGDVDPRTGLVASPSALDACVDRAVLARVDHSNLNTDVPEFRTTTPTTENLAFQIAGWLGAAWPNSGTMAGSDAQRARLARIRLEETGSNTVELKIS